MVTLTVDLQTGFENDTVVVCMNGKEVFRKKDVTTKLLYGLAETVKTEVDKGKVRLEVCVETRGIDKVIELDASSDRYIAITVEHDEINHGIQEEPYGYG